uniref:Uncharacterized protein n=1 Tax=Rhipicephalus appendiculatus TaxID=34631 RepID=A0A131YE13_RHIAP
MHKNTLNWHPIPCVVHTLEKKKEKRALWPGLSRSEECGSYCHKPHHGHQLAGTVSWTSFLQHCLGMLLFCHHSEQRDRRMSKEHEPPMHTAYTHYIVNTFRHVNMRSLLYALALIIFASSERFLTASVSIPAENQ